MCGRKSQYAGYHILGCTVPDIQTNDYSQRLLFHARYSIKYFSRCSEKVRLSCGFGCVFFGKIVLQEKGVVPLLIVEWGTPHIASWSTFRGGPDYVNIWGAYDWTQHCWMNEYNASFLGERAFVSSGAKRLMMERAQWNSKGNKKCYYGGNFTTPLIEEPDTSEVLSMYAQRNYRDMRARGVTSFLPWDIDGGTFFTNNPAIAKARVIRANPFKGIKDFGVVRSDYYSGLFDQADELPRKNAQIGLCRSSRLDRGTGGEGVHARERRFSPRREG